VFTSRVRGLSTVVLASICSFILSACPPGPTIHYDWSTVFGPQVGCSIRDLARSDSRFVAVGHCETDDATAVWTSADGTSWSQLPKPPAFRPRAKVVALTAVGAGFVAVGEDINGTQGGLIWSSLDGTDWTLMTELLVNRRTDLTDVVWDGSALIAVGSSDGQAVVFRSTSPRGVSGSWTEVFRQSMDVSTSGRNHSSQMFAVTATNSSMTGSGGPRFVAAGRRDAWPICDGVRFSDDDAAVWTSSDGTSWSLVATSLPAFVAKDRCGDEEQTLFAVMTINPVIYVGGYDRSHYNYPDNNRPNLSMMWRSLDFGVSWTRYTEDNPENRESFMGLHRIMTLYTDQPFGWNELALGYRVGLGPTIWRGATGSPRWKIVSGIETLNAQSFNAALTVAEDLMIVGGFSNAGGATIWALRRVVRN
jgi:hypothetical protein